MTDISFRVVRAANGYVVVTRKSMFAQEEKLVAKDKHEALKIIEGLL